MRLVIADTSPVNYLILIRHIDLLPRLFEKVAIPAAVKGELSDLDAPQEVRNWISNPPAWLEIHSDLPFVQLAIEGLDEGETAAIALAESLQADLLLIDERDGYRAAKRRGLRVTGTLGLLDLAAERGLIKFAAAIHELERTSFRIPTALLSTLPTKHGREKDRRL